MALSNIVRHHQIGSKYLFNFGFRSKKEFFVQYKNFSLSQIMAKYHLNPEGPYNWISNARVLPLGTNIPEFEDLEPKSGKVLAKIPESREDEVNRAVEAAKSAFVPWSQMTGLERGRILTKAGRILRDNLEDISIAETQDNGKPIWESRMDVSGVADCWEYFGGLAGSIVGQHVKLSGGSWAYVSREPIGLVGGIGAWNYPTQTCSWKAAPALAAGNTFIYKPSQFTPLTAVILGEVLKDAGLPAGVFNVIQGVGETGAIMTKHKGFDKYSFTGSVPTGTKIMQAAADGIRNITLELGGKSPLIIFDDADLKNAVKGALMANFFSQGQVCSNGTRVFVQKGIYDKFLQEFVKQASNMKIGDPMNDDTTVGATISQEQAEKVLNYIDIAKKEGGKIECGGERVMLEGNCAGGYYLSPCVVTNLTDEKTLMKEEVFGSVASVISFDSEEEVIARANNTIFGLAGGVFTKDLVRGHRVVGAINAGSCYINTYNLAPAEVPFGGFKMSGIGRENGTVAIEHYTQMKTVIVEMNDVACGQLYREDI
jgi:aldehyde dehydrogenase family 9 protein A1